MSINRKCRCKNGIIFDSGEIFESGKTYLCQLLEDGWVNVFDNSGKMATLNIEGTFKTEFMLLRY